MPAAIANACAKGDLVAIRRQHSSTSLLTGLQYRETWHVARVASASRGGEVKTYDDGQGGVARKNDRFVTVFTLTTMTPEQSARAETLLAEGATFDNQADFVAALRGESGESPDA